METLSCPGAFPSLDDGQLIDLGAPPVEQPPGPRGDSIEVTTQSAISVIRPCDKLSHEQLENKYGALSICLRSDRRTTQSRLEQLRRKRDQSETNMMAELAKCREAVSMQAPAPANAQVQLQLLEAAARAAIYMVQAAEAYGAVQQEARVVNALDLLTQYVESLKHVHSKVDEQRNLLTLSSQPSEPSPRTSRYGSLSAASAPASAKAGSKRRASIAAMPRSSTVASSLLPPGFTDDTPFRLTSGQNGRPRRVSLQPKARTSLSAIAVAAEATALANDRMLECGGGMAEITEISESRRTSVVGKSDDDVDDMDSILLRRPSVLNRMESDGSPVEDLDDAASEDEHEHLRKSSDSSLIHHEPMERMSNGVVAHSYPFLDAAFWRRGSLTLIRRLSDLRRNSYRAVRMSLSCCLLAAAAAVLVSTLLGGGATTSTQRRRH